MYKDMVDPNRVLPWKPANTDEYLLKLANVGNLVRAGRAPVFEIPDQYQVGDYVLIDGHHRRETALAAKKLLPIVAVQKPYDFKLIAERYRFNPFANDKLIMWSKYENQQFDELRQQFVDRALIYLRSTIPRQI